MKIEDCVLRLCILAVKDEALKLFAVSVADAEIGPDDFYSLDVSGGRAVS